MKLRFQIKTSYLGASVVDNSDITLVTMINNNPVTPDYVNDAYELNVISSTAHPIETTFMFHITITSTLTSQVLFSGNFELYGYDIGNNSVIDDNPPFVFQVYDTAKEGPDSVRIFSFLALKKPFTDLVYYYNTATLPVNSSVEFIDDCDRAYLSGNGFFMSEIDVTLRQRVTTYRIVNCQQVVDTVYLSDYYTVKDTTDYISHTVYHDYKACEEKPVVGTENKVLSYVDYLKLTTYRQNDVRVNPYKDDIFIYQLFDYQGQLVDEYNATRDITTPVPFSTYNPDTTKYLFTVPDIGDFLIKVTKRSRNTNGLTVAECVKTLKFTACLWYTVDRISCNEYKVSNCSFESITLKISKMQDDKTFLLTETRIIPFLSNMFMKHTDDGVYQYEVVRNDKSYIYIIVNYCNLISCLKPIIQNLLCEEECDECLEKELNKLNRILFTSLVLFADINDLYNFSFLFEALNPAQIDDLYEMSQILKRLDVYCGCGENTTVPKSPCGCS